jgi:phosphoenolpyruvate synthase/pyruvate phosphate dikinase
MPKEIIYEEHPREYTVLGISVMGNEVSGRGYKKFLGAGFSEMISVIENGRYYYIQPVGEWEKIGRAFLRRVNKGKVNLSAELAKFKKDIARFEKLLGKSEKTFSLEDIKDFFQYYSKLAAMACVGYSTLDYIDELDRDKRARYQNWVEKVRRIGENVYKVGEMEFVPRYASWLAKTYLPRYKPEELQYVFFREMEGFIDKGRNLPDPKILRARKKLFYMRQYPFNQVQLLTGERAKKEIQRKGLLQKKELDPDIKELLGQVAYTGKVKGKVKVIFARKEMVKFKKGDVLVSPMTEPGYLPIMKKAAAMVTDEGGLLCHASIVARELKIPCIIGTKIATKVLKNGDLVEVDADRGVVKILK